MYSRLFSPRAPLWLEFLYLSKKSLWDSIWFERCVMDWVSSCMNCCCMVLSDLMESLSLDSLAFETVTMRELNLVSKLAKRVERSSLSEGESFAKSFCMEV